MIGSSDLSDASQAGLTVDTQPHHSSESVTGWANGGASDGVANDRGEKTTPPREGHAARFRRHAASKHSPASHASSTPRSHGRGSPPRAASPDSPGAAPVGSLSPSNSPAHGKHWSAFDIEVGVEDEEAIEEARRGKVTGCVCAAPTLQAAE